ncbi:hypothetical protein V8E54_009044 [Elaphomyces granulatus]
MTELERWRLPPVQAVSITRFYAWDRGSGITVLLACRLVACNESDGFLTKDWNGSGRITDPDDSLLAHGIYFFHTTMTARVSGGATNSSASPIIISRDGKCCVSSCLDALERAQLCPQPEKDWFQLNSMEEYNSNISLSDKYWLDGQVNSISLRSDIHWAFDAGSFAIVRKDGFPETHE